MTRNDIIRNLFLEDDLRVSDFPILKKISIDIDKN